MSDKVQIPSIARQLFARLCKGDNLLLSRNGPAEDSELFSQVEAEEENCRSYFEALGFQLQRADNCYYFSVDDEPQINMDVKLDKLIKLVLLLDFLKTNVESFGEGQIFSASTVAAKITGDPRAERFLFENGKGGSYPERLENVMHSLVRLGYLSEYDTNRKEYRVLSAINYLFEFLDRIQITNEQTTELDEETRAES